MKKKLIKQNTDMGTRYESILEELAGLIETAKRSAAQSVNSIMTAAYWLIGRRIVEVEQSGKVRADYGTELLKQLALDLTNQFGRGFSERNLEQMRLFYLNWPISQTVSAKSSRTLNVPGTDAVKQSLSLDTSKANFQTPSGKSQTPSAELLLSKASACFPLSWSAYVSLLSVRNGRARQFYETEALRGGWSVRQLNRQIDTQFYERTALSKNKTSMLVKGQKKQPQDKITPQEEIKDPYILEFLGLKDEYSESDLEEALIRHRETFLLELGEDFCFVGRQKRLRIGDQWYRMDLVFFHRRLRCLVVIDLKLGKFTHADVGQMHLYLNYAQEHWMRENENPPVGLILCAQKDDAIAHYALENLPNKVMASEYVTALPNERLLARQIQNTRSQIEKPRKQLPSKVKKK